MDNVVSIFSKQEPCKYMAVDNVEFIKCYMGDVLHSFNCVDCQSRYKSYLRGSANTFGDLVSNGDIVFGEDIHDD